MNPTPISAKTRLDAVASWKLFSRYLELVPNGGVLPVEYVNWNTVYKRFARWCYQDFWGRMLQHSADDPDVVSVVRTSSLFGV